MSNFLSPTPSVTVRTARLEDFPTIARLLRQLYVVELHLTIGVQNGRKTAAGKTFWRLGIGKVGTCTWATPAWAGPRKAAAMSSGLPLSALPNSPSALPNILTSTVMVTQPDRVKADRLGTLGQTFEIIPARHGAIHHPFGKG